MERPPNSTYDPNLSDGLTLSGHATRSSLFLFIAKGIRYSFVFIVQLILMNLLMPSDFGLIRFVTIVIGSIDLVNELGLSYALVQKKSLLDAELSSAFSLNALISGALYSLAFFIAPLCATFFGNDQIAILIRVGAFASFFGSLSVVHRSLLQRRLHYGRLAIIEVASALAGSGGALLLAIGGYGVWSLLASMFIFQIVSSCALMVTTSWPRGNYLNLASAKVLFFFGGAVVIQRVINYGVQNFDSLIVGKSFGEESLGIYSIAVMLITMPQLAIGIVFDSVLLSAFSRIQDDNQRLAAAFLKANAFTSIVSVPFFILIFTFSKEMMRAISFLNHSDAWLPAALPLKIFSLLGLLFVFSSFTGTLWLAKGKVRLRIYWETVGLATIVIAVLAGRPFGINGICSAIVIGGVFLFPLHVMITRRVIGLQPLIFIQVLLPSIICGMGMLAVTMFVSKLISGDSFTRDVWTLLAGTVGGLAVYSLLIVLFFKDRIKSLFEIVLLLRGFRVSA
jgi:O-antigen/teichoic acid export membrane protein